jgi:hypothetical protein
MISISEKSEYTGMVGVQHICDRCQSIICFADTLTPPKANYVEICQKCAIELYNKELEANASH